MMDRINQIQAVPVQPPQSARKLLEKGGSLEEGFAGSLAQAGITPLALQEQIVRQGSPLETPTYSKPEMNQSESVLGQKSVDSTVESAKNLPLNSTQLTQKPAVSLNTADRIAGLKPWSKEWVFNGEEGGNPSLRPLFQEQGRDVLIPQASQDVPLAILNSRRGETGMPLVKETSEGALASSQLQAKAQTQPQVQSMAQLLGELHAVVDEMPHAKETVPHFSQTAFSPIETIQMQPARSVMPVVLSGSDYLETLRRVIEAEPRSSLGLPLDLKEGKVLQPQTSPAVRVGAEASDQSRDAGVKNTPDLLWDAAKEVESPAFQARMKKHNSGGKSDEFLSSLDALSASLVDGTNSPQGVNAQPVLFQKTVLPKMELSGHVVPGSMTRERLTSETLIGLTNQMRHMSGAGGGEIRLHLKPDNLGEMRLRVITRGRDVALKIQASNASSKRVIEESLTYLKDTLATQNLNLGRVEVSVSQPHESTLARGGTENPWQQGGSNLQQFDGWMGQSANQGGRNREAWDGSSESLPGARVNPAVLKGTPSTRMAASGRLDVMA